MFKAAIITAAMLNSVSVKALAVPNEVDTHADSAGSLTLFNNCPFNIFASENNSNEKPTIIIPNGMFSSKLLRDKSNTYTYQLTTKPMGGKEPVESWLEMIYRYKSGPGHAEAISHLYPVFDNPLPGKFVALGLSAASTGPGSAAAAASAASSDNGARVAAGAVANTKGIGSGAISLTLALCHGYTDGDDEGVIALDKEQPQSQFYRSSVYDYQFQDKTYGDVNITKIFSKKD